MLVQDLLSTDVVTVPATATLRDAVERLLSEGVGSVVVVSEEGHPSGIVTERDVLRALYAAEASLDAVAVADSSHRPVVRTKPSETVPYLANRMAAEGVKKAAVMDDLDLVGIVTVTDVVASLPAIRKEASDQSEAPDRWTPN